MGQEKCMSVRILLQENHFGNQMVILIVEKWIRMIKKPIYIKEITGSIDFTNCQMFPLTQDAASEISQWEYEKPYDAYNFKDHPNGYLWDESTWGREQFYLVNNSKIIGHVSCQFDGTDLWVGWAMNPQLCGKGNGAAFSEKCVENYVRLKDIPVG